ncbi:MAG: GNAT family N-acetyltransferase [Muribaculaceae bacterium]|nr:GNAT family N-acetyltransferase [Muribaculaceae bacterium]
MEDSIVRKEMMRLWKENFHDSDEYINLVFDAYFLPDMVEYEERDGKIVSALLAVPYSFGNARQSIRGLYLCGLSTDLDYRRRGIMGDVLERFINRIDRSRYAFTFLIPADGSLQKYYHDRGFVNAFYRMPMHYVSSHDFRREFFNTINNDTDELISLKKHYWESLKLHRITGESESYLLNKICIFIKSQEGKKIDMQLMHSSLDILTGIDECVISGGEIYALENGKSDITAVGFFYINNEDKTLSIYYSVQGDPESGCRLLDEIKNSYPDYSMTIWRYPVKSELGGLWQPFYAASLPEAPLAGAVGESLKDYHPVGHSEVYGMTRILNLHEILKFQGEERRDLKYSILVKEGKNPRFVKYEAKNGEVIATDVTTTLSEDEKRRVLMTEEDVAEILFRRPDTDPIVEDVMELPPLGGAISMMLD